MKKKGFPCLKVCFKEWENKLKKIKLKKDRMAFLILVIAGILAISFSIFYFKSLVDKERLETKRKLEEILRQMESGAIPAPPEEIEQVSPETLYRLREVGVERYFLSEVKLIGVYYTPMVHTCLFEKEKPIYPLYIYETQSLAIYPEKPPPEIALIRYLLLPEDNPDFQPDKACYIKEIKTDEDWQEVEEEYGFSRRQF